MSPPVATCGNGNHCKQPPAPGRKTCERHLQLARDRWARQKAACAQHTPDATCAHCRREAVRKATFQANHYDMALAKTCYRHGTTVEAYEQMLGEQGGVCRICQAPPEKNERGRRLAVDHDHRCCPGPNSCGGCIRGLLCYRCNVALGAFGDDCERLRAAIAYLERKA